MSKISGLTTFIRRQKSLPSISSRGKAAGMFEQFSATSIINSDMLRMLGCAFIRSDIIVEPHRPEPTIIVGCITFSVRNLSAENPRIGLHNILLKMKVASHRGQALVNGLLQG